jgi:hypothetical protein
MSEAPVARIAVETLQMIAQKIAFARQQPTDKSELGVACDMIFVKHDVASRSLSWRSAAGSPSPRNLKENGV